MLNIGFHRTLFRSTNLGLSARNPLGDVSYEIVEVIINPIISGIGTTGNTLTAIPGQWSFYEPTGQWYENYVPIAGETGLTYLVAAEYSGNRFTYVETNTGVKAESNAINDIAITWDNANVTFDNTIITWDNAEI